MELKVLFSCCLFPRNAQRIPSRETKSPRPKSETNCLTFKIFVQATLFAPNLWTCRHVRGRVEMWTCGRVNMWTCGRVDMWTCGHVDVWTCGRVDMWTCGRVDMWTWTCQSIVMQERFCLFIWFCNLCALQYDLANYAMLQNEFSEDLMT